MSSLILKAAALTVAIATSAAAFAEDSAPKGTEVLYSKEAAGTFVLNGRLGMYMDTFPATIIWGDDGKVFFKNFISVYPDDYYIEASMEGSILTMPMGQTVQNEDDSAYGIALGIFKTIPRIQNGNEVIDFEYAPEVESITFTVDGDGFISMVLPGEPFDGENPPEYVVGLYYTDDFSFVGYSDFFQEYTRTELTMVTIPEDAEVQQYAYVDPYNYASIVDVAFHDGYLYIRGLSSMLPEGTIKAKIDGDKAVVAQDEFLGIYFDQYFIFTKVLYGNPDYDEEDPDSDPFILAPSNVGFELNIDSEGKIIYADKEGTYLSFHCNDNDFLSSLGYFDVFELKYQDTFAGTPANPVRLEYHTEWAQIQGFNDFFFTLSNFSTEGTLLDPDHLYYKVVVNGTPQIFVQSYITNLLGQETMAYAGVPIRVELIPYGFNNNEDIFKFADNAFDIGIYQDDVKTIGVQTVYVYDNEYTYSSLVTLDVATGEVSESGMPSLSAELNVISTEYYTLDGRRIAYPDKGIFIEVNVLEDGSRVSKKIAR